MTYVNIISLAPSANCNIGPRWPHLASPRIAPRWCILWLPFL